MYNLLTNLKLARYKEEYTDRLTDRLTDLYDRSATLPVVLHLQDVSLRQLLGRVGVREATVVLRARAGSEGRRGYFLHRPFLFLGTHRTTGRE